jgi:hypothetical protein
VRTGVRIPVGTPILNAGQSGVLSGAVSSERIAVSVGSCALSSVRWQHSLRVLVSHLERRGILVRDAESSQLRLQDEDSEDALGQLEST